MEDKLYDLQAKGYSMVLKNHLMVNPEWASTPANQIPVGMPQYLDGWCLTAYAPSPYETIHGGVFQTIDEAIEYVVKRADERKTPLKSRAEYLAERAQKV